MATPPRAWGRQRDFIVFFIRFSSFTLISKLPQAARGVPCQPPGTIAPSISRLHCRLMLPLSAVLILLPPGRGTPGIFPLWQTSGRASPSAPCSRCSDGAGAKAIPDARRADGAPQQARTSPGPRGREGSRRCPARHAAGGVQPDSRDKFRVTGKRGVRGCRGCRGAAAPLTPCPAPGRRPAAHTGQQPQDRKKGISHRIGRNVPPHAQGNLALKRLSENEIQKNKTGNDQKSIFGKDTLPVVFVHDF